MDLRDGSSVPSASTDWGTGSTDELARFGGWRRRGITTARVSQGQPTGEPGGWTPRQGKAPVRGMTSTRINAFGWGGGASKKACLSALGHLQTKNQSLKIFI